MDCAHEWLVSFVPSPANPNVSPQDDKTVGAADLTGPRDGDGGEPADPVPYNLAVLNQAKLAVLAEALDFEMRSGGRSGRERVVIEGEPLIAEFGCRNQVMHYIKPSLGHHAISPAVEIPRATLKVTADFKIRRGSRIPDHQQGIKVVGAQWLKQKQLAVRGKVERDLPEGRHRVSNCVRGKSVGPNHMIGHDNCEIGEALADGKHGFVVQQLDNVLRRKRHAGGFDSCNDSICAGHSVGETYQVNIELLNPIFEIGLHPGLGGGHRQPCAYKRESFHFSNMSWPDKGVGMTNEINNDRAERK